jgi:hypothetical protein
MRLSIYWLIGSGSDMVCLTIGVSLHNKSYYIITSMLIEDKIFA